MTTVEHFLSTKLQQFSVIDFMCVKAVYFVLALLVASLYVPLRYVSPWAYLILGIIAALPLWIHFYGVQGNLLVKTKHFLKTNTPSNQVLTLISCFSFGIFIALLLPVLLGFSVWVYIVLIVVLAIKPIQVAWFW